MPEPVRTRRGADALEGPANRMLSVRALASHLNVSRSTIRRMVESGQIPYMRVRKVLRFDMMAVRAVIDKKS